MARFPHPNGSTGDAGASPTLPIAALHAGVAAVRPPESTVRPPFVAGLGLIPAS